MNNNRNLFDRLATIGAIAIIGLFLVAATTQAATIEKDGDTATAIRDLQIGSRTYDVEFLFNSAFNLYPLQRFDFDTFGEAQIAVSAIVNVLNADGGVLTVGESAAEADVYENFDIPYEAFERVFDPPGEIFKPVKITFLRLAEAYTGDANQPGVWVEGGVVDGGTLFASAMYAKFTLVGEGGSGNSPPVADAGGPIYTGEVGEPVNFDGSGSFDPDGTIVDRNWFFGDGGTSDGETTSHIYVEPGPYNISHEVIDEQGKSDTDSATALIGESSHLPQADARGPYHGTVDAAVSFDGSMSTDPDGKIATWAWDFGDSSQGTGPTPKHTYDTAGIYSVQLTVTDDSGETDIDITVATIGLGNLPPFADAGGPYIGAAEIPKIFDGSGSSDLDGDVVSWSWDFGDGNTGVGERTTHTYAAPGSYPVSLIVTDDGDATSSTETTAVMGENPLPDDRLIDLVTLDDVGRSPAADLAVLNVTLANGDTLNEEVHVHDGGSGNEIYDIVLSSEWNSLAIDQATTATGQRLAILQSNTDGAIRVQFLDAENGSEVLTVSYFDDTWTPIDILNVRDAGGLGIEGIGVLAENRDGQQAIEVRTALAGALVNQVLYFNDVWKASYAVDLGEFNGNGRSELSVLATNNAGKHAVETRDALSGKQISRYFFLGPTNTMKGLAQAVDVDGNGRPELIVLGNKEADNSTANTAQVKDVKTDALISKPGSFAPPFVGFALRSMEDVDGNTSPEMVIGAFDDEGNITRVQVRDVLNGTLTLNTGMLSAAFDPKDLEILEDVSGNGIQELVAAGLDSETLAIRVQTRDGQDGTLLLNIDIN